MKFRRNLDEIRTGIEKKIDKFRCLQKKFRRFQILFRQNLDIIQKNLDIDCYKNLDKIQTKFRQPIKNLDKIQTVF